jgi:hypothetical protein
MAGNGPGLLLRCREKSTGYVNSGYSILQSLCCCCCVVHRLSSNFNLNLFTVLLSITLPAKETSFE